jgi:DNA-binding NarL/FixJ family response regulator
MTASTELGNPIRVAIVANPATSKVVKNALRGSNGDFSTTTLSGTPIELCRKLAKSRANVVLVCEESGSLGHLGRCILVALRAYRPLTRAVLVLDSNKAGSAIDAFRDGARGVYYLNPKLEDISKCVHEVHAGHFWIGNSDIERAVNALRRKKLRPLKGPRTWRAYEKT